MRLSVTVHRTRHGNRVIVVGKRNNWRPTPYEGELPYDLVVRLKAVSRVGQKTVLKPGERFYRQALGHVPCRDATPEEIDRVVNRLVRTAVAGTRRLGKHGVRMAFHLATQKSLKVG
jgi:hypothetical protein